jgi:hypothetical protein
MVTSFQLFRPKFSLHFSSVQHTNALQISIIIDTVIKINCRYAEGMKENLFPKKLSIIIPQEKVMLEDQRKDGVIKEVSRKVNSPFVLILIYSYCNDYEYD